MESPRKFNDCYFYYYSTCTKGDNCVFRHEPSALGCETMCTAWQQGKCLDKRCKLRHMELRKNRKQIPCYWENQPGGCRKKHCPFMHKNPDARTDGIAPSQPAPPVQNQAVVATDIPEPVPLPAAAAPPPAAVPMLWQQRQALISASHCPPVVLDSSILGVLPGGAELMGGRRLVSAHEAAAPNPYAAMPVDPLVVNFEEESDNESAPSSTPTKTVSPDDSQRVARTKSQELYLLEKIQAEAAAFYSYDDSTPHPDTHRKLVRANLSTKYERLSLDEIAGKNQNSLEVKRTSLDFKILSLDEIRARKKVNNDSIVQSTPITLNLNRKRKLSTHESLTASGKVIKVVRSNSIVYKKFDDPVNLALSQAKSDSGSVENELASRKRSYSEQSDILEINDDELDDCVKFKRIKIAVQTTKPKLIRNTSKVSNSSDTELKDATDLDRTEDSDSEVQIIEDPSDDLSKVNTIDSEVIDLDESNNSHTVDYVDLSDDLEESGTGDIEVSSSNVPDVVASCVSKSNKTDSPEKDLLHDIDSILSDDSL